MMLVAVPQLVDPNFKRAVVLVLHHDQNGAFGLVVNDPAPMSFAEFAKRHDIGCHQTQEAETLYHGGPVEPYRGWILHQDANLPEKQAITPDLYISASNESLRQVLESGVRPAKFCLGYAGWAGQQLEKELQEGSWITTPVHSQYIFYQKPEDTWDAILHDMGVDPARLAQGHGIH